MHSLLFPAELSPPAATSLSLQFLIQELLNIFRWLQKNHSHPPLHLEAISTELGLMLATPCTSSMIQKKGLLDNMYGYIHILFQNASLGYQIPVLQRLDSLKYLACELSSYLAKIYKTPSLIPPSCSDVPLRTEEVDSEMALTRIIRDKWSHFLQRIETECTLLFADLFSFIQEVQHDENLLFLLIEQKDPLNQYLGHRAIETIFERLFPQGPCTLREALYNGYARRGFLDFYARHEKLIESIDWEQPCPLVELKLPS